MTGKKKMKVDTGKCMHCGACVGTCPKNAIFLNEVELVFNESCVFCGICVKTCPVGALSIVGP